MIGEKSIMRHGVTWHKITINQKRDLLRKAREDRRGRIVADLKLAGADARAIYGELQAFDGTAMTVGSWFELIDSLDGRVAILELAARGADLPPLSEREETELVADLCGIELRKPADESEPADCPTKTGETEESYGQIPSSAGNAA